MSAWDPTDGMQPAIAGGGSLSEAAVLRAVLSDELPVPDDVSSEARASRPASGTGTR